ncbi:MAG: Translation initiation factor 2, partial [Labilithrix sp.]|nr:Translation initiation factor 2 [Labilithrix sp.]
MTMRLDIVTNDAGELVRREHARELGAGVVVAIYRLAKLAQMHDLGNQAFIRQLEQCHQMIGEYCLRSGSNVSVLFADKATFVAGQLLKGNRGAYEAAAELGALLENLGGSELHISRDITREDLNAFAEQISLFHRTGSAAQVRIPPKMHLRRVADAARLRGIELENLTPDQRIVRAYASAVVIMRRFFEDLAASRYVLPRRIKRIAQSLVDLSDASTASYLGVTEVRNANYDEAGRAVNTAILAVSIARETIQDRTALAQIAMAAMMHDVARPRALALAGASGSPMPGMAGPTMLSEDQEDRLAAGAAAVLTALGRVNEPSITRTVLTFEALWLRRRTWLGPVYWGARPPTMHASIIAVARRYNDLLTPEPGLAPPTTDYAVAMLANELTDAQDRTVLRMLVSALGLLPTGTLVQLSTGEVAEVTRGTKALGEKACVNIVADANGQQYPQPVEVDLAHDPRRTVLRVLGVDGWRKGLENGPQGIGAGPESDEDVIVSVPPAPMPAVPPPPAPISPLSPIVPKTMPPGANRSIADQYADQYASWGDSGSPDQTGRSESGASGEHPASASMPSMGSSPSAVAEAMGRMINDSLRPPSMPPREADRPDRTVFQPQNPDDAPAPHVATSITREPTARGNLAATPLPHVLVYMLDHALTGSVVFEGTNEGGRGPGDDTIYFVNGVPAKVRLCESVALLGEVLVEDGSLDARAVEQAVDGARRLGILLGEYLVGHDLVSREALAWGLEGQLLRKIAHVANLAPEIQYAYYRDVDLLEGVGGEIVVTHPLNPILASVRHWTDRARVRATLNRIGKHPLALHPDSDLTNLAVIAEEQTVLDAIRGESMPLQQLFKQQLADEEVVSSLVYSLAVTRQFAFKGQKKGPMAARGAAWRSVGPPGSGSAPGSKSPPGPTSPPPIASGSRPAIPVAPVASRAAAGGAPPESPRTSSPSTPNKIGPSSTPMRAAVPSSASRVPVAARPPVAAPPQGGPARPVAPAIRPITTKKPTMVGLQAGAPPELRAPPPSTRQPNAARSGRGELEGRSPSNEIAAPKPETSRPSTPPDDAKTIARPAPSLKDIMASRAPAPPQPGPGAMPRPAPPKPGMPSTSRPTPPVKTPGAAPPAGAKSSVTGSNPIAKAPPVLSVPAGRKPSTIDDDFSDDVTNKRAPIDIDKCPPSSRAVEI